MSVSLTYATTVTVVEILASASTPAAAAAGRTITHGEFNTTASLTASTTPPVTVVAAFTKALSSGTGTIDLTALTGTNGATVVGTGLKVQAWRFKNPSTNANQISIAEGAANGYALGGASFLWILQPGQEIVGYGNDATPDVASGDKNIDLAGTGAQELQVELVLG